MKNLCLAVALVVAGVSFGFAAAETPWPVLTTAVNVKQLPNTKLLDWEGDLASRMIDGVDRFLLREIDATKPKRQQFWKRDYSSPTAYAESVAPNRERLAKILGINPKARPARPRFEYADWRPEPLAEAEGFVVRRVRWQAFGDVHGVGLLLEPRGNVLANVITIPDADQSPEEVAGLIIGESFTSAFAYQLAEQGCRVLVLSLIVREDHPQWKMPKREWLHRPSFILGRTLAGDETQKILSAVDCLRSMENGSVLKMLIAGWGEGGRLALYSTALDTRIDGMCVSGYFAPRERVWNEPADRTVFRLLREFGDAEIASLVVPRPMIIEHSSYPEYVCRPNEAGEPEVLEEYGEKRGKPGKLIVPTHDEVQQEYSRLQQLAGLKPLAQVKLLKTGQAIAGATLSQLLELCGIKTKRGWGEVAYTKVRDEAEELAAAIANRQAGQMAEIERHNQAAITESIRIRAEKFATLQSDSLKAYQASVESFREEFRNEVIGSFDKPLLAANARSRAYQVGPKTISYEVVLEVMPEVFAYGVLTLPRDLDLSSGDRRPVVVCQHGLEGRPQDVVSEESYHYYKAFATRLAERGFVTFAPQNIYIFYDRFRTLQFKANSIGCTLYSVMVPQHKQITSWLGSLPFVDRERIAFYGLSYGGKSAMRIPPLVDGYCLSICSGDFDEWVWKNAATDRKSLQYSYANKSEYEMYEFNLGGTFNYAEMAALICPRPFMVERGHLDGVAPDEAVGYEYAKVRHLYHAKLGIGDRTKIEWFVGPHTINGRGAFTFLHKHLDWPVPQE